MAAPGARTLSTCMRRIALETCFPVMSALRPLAAGLVTLPCAGSAHAETARVTFILINDIYSMAKVAHSRITPPAARP